MIEGRPCSGDVCLQLRNAQHSAPLRVHHCVTIRAEDDEVSARVGPAFSLGNRDGMMHVSESRSDIAVRSLKIECASHAGSAV